eukprot:784835-Lingulodinium_polyedra.AAC.1
MAVSSDCRKAWPYRVNTEQSRRERWDPLRSSSAGQLRCAIPAGGPRRGRCHWARGKAQRADVPRESPKKFMGKSPFLVGPMVFESDEVNRARALARIRSHDDRKWVLTCGLPVNARINRLPRKRPPFARRGYLR